MNLSEIIVPEGVREELVQVSRSQSDALWRIARLCLKVYIDFKVRQEGGEVALEGIDDYRVWRALSHYTPQSADRIKTLATVAGEYPPEKCARFAQLYGEWDFGYYERTWRYGEIEQEAIFEYLAEVRDRGVGSEVARRLGVGEFISSYEFHVRHLQVGMPGCPDSFPGGSLFDPRTPFKVVYDAFRALRSGLGRYVYNPKVKGFLERAQALENELNDIMAEIGVDNKVESRVE